MKKALLTAVFATIAINASAATYKIDPFHTNARFSIDHFGTSSNVGGFYELTGTVEFDAEKKSGAVDITIPVDKLHSSSPQFTQHLKSPDLLNEKQAPEIRFVSTKFHFSGDKVTSVDGKLTMLGKTHEVTLKADKFNCYDSPKLKTQVCGGDFSTDRFFRIGRNKFELVHYTGCAGLQIDLYLSRTVYRVQGPLDTLRQLFDRIGRLLELSAGWELDRLHHAVQVEGHRHSPDQIGCRFCRIVLTHRFTGELFILCRDLIALIKA